MKKLLSLSIAIILLVAFILPSTVMAQDEKSLEKAITKAKSILEISDGYDTFNYNMYQDGNGKTSYSLYWSDSKGKLGEISATIDSEGRLTNYYCYKPYDSSKDGIRIPSVSKEDALKIADKFIKKVDSSLSKKIQYQENNAPISINDTTYYFSYVRLENNIPFPQDGVTISVNNRTGEIQSYYLNWTDDIKFPKPRGVISLKKAQEAYKEKLGLKLAYKLSYDGEQKTPYLVYTNVYSDRSIDAFTGEIIYGNNYIYMDEGAGSAEKAAAQENRAGNLTPEERKAIENTAGFITQANAEKTARETLKLDKSYKLNSINLYNSWENKDDYIWNLSFSKEEKVSGETRYYYATISLNAATGEVMDFYKSIPYEQGAKVKFDRDEALKIASDFIKSIQPEKYKDAEYTDWNETPPVRPLSTEELPRQQYFNFMRKANNAYFPENGFHVTVDTVSGEVISYSYTWYNGKLPSADKVLGYEKAHEIFYDEIGIELRYISVYSPDASLSIKPVPAGEEKPEIKLVYALKTEKPSNIDANTGVILDYSGKPYSERLVAHYTDIENSFANDEIKVLAQFGISLPGDKFMPDSFITQKDFLYLLAKSLNSYMDFDQDKDDTLYNYLIAQGIVKEAEKSPSSNLTKQDGIKFIIRSMGLDKAADIKGIYKLSVKDAGSINKDLFGYVALAYGLGIVKDEKGYINPSAKLTRAQSAVMIYNFLNAN